MKQNLYYPSKDGRTLIHGVCYTPDEKEPVALLQICHGMCEYIERYEEFAAFLNAYGFVVFGNDHLGHGKSVQDPGKLGYFAEENGNLCVLRDMHRLRRYMQGVYPGLPYLILGHSMGSFLTRQYLAYAGQGIAGAVIMGTGAKPEPVLAAGKALCKALAAVHGWEYPSPLVDKISFEAYNSRFEPTRTDFDWLSKNEASIDAYIADPLCNFKFTLNGFYNMFASIEDAQNPATVDHIPKDLPILFVAGEDDPVGDYGAGVKQAYRACLNAGIEDVRMELYPDSRHEILNEPGRRKTYMDLATWLLARLPGAEEDH